MSERFLKYETEAENSMVDEKGVLIPGGSAGGYIYFGVSFKDKTLFKMDKPGVLNNPDASTSDVTRSEFENAILSAPILLIPTDICGESVEFGHDSNPVKLVSYFIYSGSPKACYLAGNSISTLENIVFAAE